ncbi:MAG: nucleotidyltransferase substrate binding protein [Opitutae bacterium]|nr:nucleotidyltransferase substrate binding protein [Opitutae bacterium]
MTATRPSCASSWPARWLGNTSSAWRGNKQGLEAAGPREAFAQAFKLGWIEDETAWFDIITARNLAVHVCREASATALAAELPRHLAACQRLLAKLSAS